MNINLQKRRNVQIQKESMTIFNNVQTEFQMKKTEQKEKKILTKR